MKKQYVVEGLCPRFVYWTSSLSAAEYMLELHQYAWATEEGGA